MKLFLRIQTYLVVYSKYFEGQRKHDRNDVFELSELILRKHHKPPNE